MAEQFEVFLTCLAERHRVVLLGGLAVIAHGLSRPTKDADAWLEPMASPDAWSSALLHAMEGFPDTALFGLREKRHLAAAELATTIEMDGVIRITGLRPDLDVFRVPNNLEIKQFDLVWSRGNPWIGGVRVMDALDLLVSKEDTGREQDRVDMTFLEAKIRQDFSERLASATLQEAKGLLARYTDHAVLSAASQNPDPEVQSLAWSLLRELADSGDPFAQDMLRDREFDA